jgi:serine phosphatase RsbU (regulator of sigma subunit)
VSLVLIADDDATARAALRVALTDAGHSVLEAMTASDTISMALENEPDLLLLDVSLPDRDVLELLEELRADTELARLPVMILAADAESDLLTRTFRWDIVDFIHKPFDTDILLAKIGAHTRLSLARKFSRRLTKEMYMSRIDRLETIVKATDEDLTEAERHFTWMQPKPPQIDGYRIDVKYAPWGKLGGDFYDFVWIDPHRLAVVVGDVSGHGIQAAILQTMARKLVSLGLRQDGMTLQRAIEFANRELTNDLPPGSFVAVAVGLLDTSNHTWSHVRCGVPYPMLIRGRETESLVTPGGPLGLSKKADWHLQVGIHTHEFKAGERLLLLSDGILELFVDDERSRHFDVEGVTAAIADAPEEVSLLPHICEKADLEHRADDDTTMILISRD